MSTPSGIAWLLSRPSHFIPQNTYIIIEQEVEWVLELVCNFVENTNEGSVSINVTLGGTGGTIFSAEKNKYYPFWVYVYLSLFIQHIKRIRLLYCHLWYVWLYHTSHII